MSWGLWGASVHWYICHTFLCLLVHPFAPQFIIVIPVDNHHDGSLLYWTGGWWMYAQIHAVDLFFLCSVFMMSQASAIMAMPITPPVTNVCSSTSSLLLTVTMTPPWWGLQWCQVSRMWFCHSHWHWGTLDVLLALPLCHSSNISLRYLFRLMPIMPWVLHR